MHHLIGKPTVRECPELGSAATTRRTTERLTRRIEGGKRQGLYWHGKKISIQMLGYAYDSRGVSNDKDGDSKARGESDEPSVRTAKEQTSERD